MSQIEQVGGEILPARDYRGGTKRQVLVVVGFCSFKLVPPPLVRRGGTILGTHMLLRVPIQDSVVGPWG
jgi:hypothetical protein